MGSQKACSWIPAEQGCQCCSRRFAAALLRSDRLHGQQATTLEMLRSGQPAVPKCKVYLGQFWSQRVSSSISESCCGYLRTYVADERYLDLQTMYIVLELLIEVCSYEELCMTCMSMLCSEHSGSALSGLKYVQGYIQAVGKLSFPLCTTLKSGHIIYEYPCKHQGHEVLLPQIVTPTP